MDSKFLKMHASQGIRFIIAGGVGSTIDMLSLTLFVEYFAVDPRFAFIFSSCLGASAVFVINKFITFADHERRMAHQIFKFSMVYGVAIAMNAVLSNMLFSVGIPYRVAKLLAIGVIAAWNYSLSHGFIFKKKEKIEPAVF